MPLEVFISYAHKDRKLRDELAEHLSNLRNQQVIKDWFDGDIVEGTEWESQILTHLYTAQVILLLISASFLASKFCYSTELTEAIARHDAGQASVIPIILRPVDWRGTPFAKLQALPANGKPVSQWRSHDEAFTNVVQGIRRAIEGLQNMTLPQPSDALDASDTASVSAIIDEWVRYADLDNWEKWSQRIFSFDQPALSVARANELESLKSWLFSRIWPPSYPELEEAFKNFLLVLNDFLKTFHEHSVEWGDLFITRKFYQIQEWDPTLYNKLGNQYDFHVDLVKDLFLELTRAANYICDKVRQFIDPTFLLREGLLIVSSGPTMNLTWELLRTQYKDEERTAFPYPGLEQFKKDRANRDVHFGKGDNRN